MIGIPCDQESFVQLSRELLERGTTLRYRAKGNSMFPTIRDGDVLEVRPAQAEKARVGDILLVRRPSGGALAHRLVRKQRLQGQLLLICKGDALASVDSPLTADCLLGRVTAIERSGERIALDRWPSRLAGFLLAKRHRLVAGWCSIRHKAGEFRRRFL